MIGAIVERVGTFFGPSPKAEIAEARKTIREQIAERPRLQRELEQAQVRFATAEAARDLVGPAQERVEAAKAAADADRRQRMLAGTPGIDQKLAAALERAERELAEAEQNEEAARSTLPTLKARVTEAQDALKTNAEAVDAAVWSIRVSELEAELPAVKEAVATVAAFQRQVAVLSDVGLRHKLYMAPGGSVPAELKRAADLPKIDLSSASMQAEIRAEYQRLRQMRSNPDA